MKFLIISGDPIYEDLITAWQLICDEYILIDEDSPAETAFSQNARIERLKTMREVIERCVEALKIKYDKDLADILEMKGYGLIDISGTREDYLKSLMAIEMSSRTLLVLINQTRAAMATSGEKVNSGEDPASIRFSYMRECSYMSKYQGSRIDPKAITVYEYRAIVKNFMAEQKTKEDARQ